MILRCTFNTKRSLCRLHTPPPKLYISRLNHSPSHAPPPPPPPTPNTNTNVPPYFEKTEQAQLFSTPSSSSTDNATPNPLHTNSNPFPNSNSISTPNLNLNSPHIPFSFPPPSPNISPYLQSTLSLALAFLSESQYPMPYSPPPFSMPYPFPQSVIPNFPQPTHEPPTPTPPPTSEYIYTPPSPSTEPIPSETALETASATIPELTDAKPEQSAELTVESAKPDELTTDALKRSTIPEIYKTLIFKILKKRDLQKLDAILPKFKDSKLLADSYFFNFLGAYLRGVDDEPRYTVLRSLALERGFELVPFPAGPLDPKSKTTLQLFGLCMTMLERGDHEEAHKLLLELKARGKPCNIALSRATIKCAIEKNQLDFPINLLLEGVDMYKKPYIGFLLHLCEKKDDARLRVLFDTVKIHEKVPLYSTACDTLIEYFASTNDVAHVLAIVFSQDVSSYTITRIWSLLSAQQCLDLYEHLMKKDKVRAVRSREAAARLHELNPDETICYAFVTMLASVRTSEAPTELFFPLIRAMVQGRSKTNKLELVLETMHSRRLTMGITTEQYEELVAMLDLSEVLDRELLLSIHREMEATRTAATPAILRALLNASFNSKNYARVIGMFHELRARGCTLLPTDHQYFLLACAHMKVVDRNFTKTVSYLIKNATTNVILAAHKVYKDQEFDFACLQLYRLTREAGHHYPPKLYNELLPILVRQSLKEHRSKSGEAKSKAYLVVDALEYCRQSEIPLIPKVHNMIERYVQDMSALSSTQNGVTENGAVNGVANGATVNGTTTHAVDYTPKTDFADTEDVTTINQDNDNTTNDTASIEETEENSFVIQSKT